MVERAEGKLIWEPDASFKESANLTRYMGWLAASRGLKFEDYDALWRWSVDDPRASGNRSSISSTSASRRRLHACSPRATCRARCGSPAPR